MFHLFQSKRTGKIVSDTISDITNAICKNDNLVKYLYYTDNDPLSQPKLTIDQKRGLLGVHIIPAPIANQTNPKCEIRPHFAEGKLTIDIIVPDEFLYVKNGQRNWLMADEFLKCVGFIGFRNIGRPTFGKFEQRPQPGPNLSCLRLTTKTSFWK